ncbi:MAG: hypothetical protein ABIA04_15385 [Pseudomonadota bacterium]
MPHLPKLLDPAISKDDFIKKLKDWCAGKGLDPDEYVGDFENYGRVTWIRIHLVANIYLFLNSDTKRKGVEKFLKVYENDWYVVENTRGNYNKVAFGANKEVIENFYLYTCDVYNKETKLD